MLDLGLGEVVVEGKGKRTASDVLRNGEHALAGTVALPDVRLKVYGGKYALLGMPREASTRQALRGRRLPTT